jgi:hypothetical protein
MTLLVVGVLAVHIQYLNIKQFILITPFYSDDAVLSKEAGKYPEKFYIDDDFGPTAIFYSGKNVVKLSHEDLKPLFDSNQPFILITHPWRLEENKVAPSQYQFVASRRDQVLIRRAK